MRDSAAPAHAIDAILSHAAAHPDAPAILAQSGTGTLSYAGLAALIEASSVQLAGLGLRTGDRAVLLAPQGPMTTTALLALSAFLEIAPIAHGATHEIGRAIERLKPRLLVSQEPPDPALRAILAQAGVAFMLLDEGPSGLPGDFRLRCPEGRGRGEPASSPGLGRSGPDEVALLLPTSGTTGRPKLVALTHANLGHMVLNAARCLNLGPGDICVNPMPMHHIHGIAIGTFLPLASGGATTALARPGGAAVLAAAAATGATWYSAVPTIHQDVLRAAVAGTTDRTALSLRFARSSSSALSASTRAGLMAQIGLPVFEGLGMTEAASWLLQQPAGIPPEHGTVGCGQGVETAVLAADGAIETGTGAVGELLVRGPNVITRYAGGPDEDDRFVDGWLRTGDKVRIRSNGDIEVIGRLKELINRGGATIAPVEVEGTLLDHPVVAEAIAFGVDHPTLDQELAAGVVLAPGATADPHDIRRWMSTRVTLEKLPRIILILERIPLNAIGKPERIAAADILGDAIGATGEPARGPVEEVIADIVAELLPGRAIGRSDDLFLAGADSLLLLRLQIRVEEVFGVWLTLDDMAERADIARLAGHLETVSDPATIAALRQIWEQVEPVPGDPDIARP